MPASPQQVPEIIKLLSSPVCSQTQRGQSTDHHCCRFGGSPLLSRPLLGHIWGHSLNQTAKVSLDHRSLWIKFDFILLSCFPASQQHPGGCYGHSVLAATTRGGSSESWQRQCSFPTTLSFSINFFHAQLWFNSRISIQANIKKHLPKWFLYKGLCNGNI